MESLSAVVFVRYTTKFSVRLASSCQFLLLHAVVRAVPRSGAVLSKVRDMSTDLTAKLVVYGAAFILMDAMGGFVMWSSFLKEGNDMRKPWQAVGAIFMDLRFIMMISVCMVCCNSDIFVTFAETKFCK